MTIYTDQYTNSRKSHRTNMHTHLYKSVSEHGRKIFSFENKIEIRDHNDSVLIYATHKITHIK